MCGGTYAIELVHVPGKSILKSVSDVRACGLFFGRAMCDHAFAHYLVTK